MDELIVLTFVLLFIKHYIIDFPWQSQVEVENKGIYGRMPGIIHSLKHGFGTALVFLAVNPWSVSVVFLGLVDFLVHYHVDWAKMRFGCRDVTQRRFWNQLGLDQLAHYLTYAGLVYWAMC